jgi:hypothetical protein
VLYFNQPHEDFSVVVRDSQGRIQLQSALQGSISLQQFAQGMYWVEISNGTHTKLFRVIR